MINQAVKASATKLKGFKAMLLLQLWVLLEEHHKIKCTMNLALNHLNSGYGWEDFFMFYKYKTFKIPEYLYYLIPNDHQPYNNQNLDFVETYFCRTDAFKYSFFPMLNAKSYSMFRKSLLSLVNKAQIMFYKICDPLGLKFLTARLRLGLSLINEHRFNYNFDSCVNPYVLAALNRNQQLRFFPALH